MLLWGIATFLYSQDEISKITITHGPYLQNVGSNEATIVWITDKPSIGWVELASDGNGSFYAKEHPRYFDTSNGIKNTSTIHAVKIKGLTPGKQYRYRVFAQEVLKHTGYKIIYGDYASTDVYYRKPLTFHTCNPQAPATSFVMVNDIHGDNKLLEDLMSRCNLTQTDFVLFNGDMLSFMNSEEQLFKGFMDTAVRLFASEIPMYYARGNHETRGVFATEIQRYFSPCQEHLYYAFRQGPVYCVVLDTGEDKPDSDIEYAGITQYDFYRAEQSEWLAGILESAEYKEAPFKIIVAHIPPAVTEAGPDEDWHGNIEVEQKFMPLLRQAYPDLMLCGHLHRFVRHDATDKTSFPVVVNANTSLLRIYATTTQMKIEVIDRNGKMLDEFIIKK